MSEVESLSEPATQSMVTVRLSDELIHPEQIGLPRSPSSRGSRISRSTSSTSLSEQDTGSIDSVDWEGLEKSEEEEAKVDGTDEVRLGFAVVN